MHETRVGRDASTGRPILVAPHRRSRPMHTVPGRDGADICPFCPGAEGETPPEIDAVRVEGTAPDTPGWSVRAFPNRYPAAPWHEVIAEGPEHEAQPARQPESLWRTALPLWRRRLQHVEKQDGVGHAFLFKNVGREAGASIAHNHSQLLGMPELPPRLRLELRIEQERDGHVVRELEHAAREGRVIVAGRRHALFCPRQPKLPFETWLAPFDRDDDFDAASDDADLAAVLSALFNAVDRAFGAPAFNLWLHRIPGEHFHWHFECQPRIGFFAGLELGADAYINSVTAVDAAARMREALGG
ncbi:MAG: hypothetical protein U1F36_10455 [Planctomycetota bacterium]